MERTTFLSLVIKLIQSLNKDMENYSKEQKYENAGKTRDLISAVQTTISKQIINKID